MGVSDWDDGDYDYGPEDYSDPDAPSAAEVEEAFQRAGETQARRLRERVGQPEIEEHFLYWNSVARDDVDAFQEALEGATRESDMQAFLESRPHLLIQTLSGGHGRWLIPQKRLGSELVTSALGRGCLADGHRRL